MINTINEKDSNNFMSAYDDIQDDTKSYDIDDYSALHVIKTKEDIRCTETYHNHH